MNAPETHITEPINAAHAVLMRATEALCAQQVAKDAAVAKATATKQLKELNDLGMLEMEIRKGGTPFYFLTTPTQIQASSPETQVTSGEMQATSIDWTAPEMNYLAPEDYELPPADPVMLALANRELGQQLEAAKVERDDLRARLDALTEQWEADTGRLTADLRAAIEAKSHAINEADRLRAELAVERQAREALQEHDIAGYIVSATKREPLMCKSLNKARKVAMSAIRSGARRAAVNPVLPPVGVAIKGAEWRAKA